MQFDPYQSQEQAAQIQQAQVRAQAQAQVEAQAQIQAEQQLRQAQQIAQQQQPQPQPLYLGYPPYAPLPPVGRQPMYPGAMYPNAPYARIPANAIASPTPHRAPKRLSTLSAHAGSFAHARYDQPLLTKRPSSMPDAHTVSSATAATVTSRTGSAVSAISMDEDCLPSMRSRTESYESLSQRSLSQSATSKPLQPLPQGAKAHPHHKVSAFVAKLYAMLQDPKLSHLIWWSRLDEGDYSTFALLPGSEFARSLTGYFKHGNVASFVRQLHMYGFHKVCDSSPPPAPPRRESGASAQGDSASATATNSAKEDSADKKQDAQDKKEQQKTPRPIWEFRHSTSKFRKGGQDTLYMIRRRPTASRSASNVAHAAHQAAAAVAAASVSPAGASIMVPQFMPPAAYGGIPQQFIPAQGYPLQQAAQGAAPPAQRQGTPPQQLLPGDNASFSFRPLARRRYPSLIVDPYAAPPVPPVTFSPAQAAALAVSYYGPRHSLSELQAHNSDQYIQYPAGAQYYGSAAAAVADRSASMAVGADMYAQRVAMQKYAQQCAAPPLQQQSIPQKQLQQHLETALREQQHALGHVRGEQQEISPRSRTQHVPQAPSAQRGPGAGGALAHTLKSSLSSSVSTTRDSLFSNEGNSISSTATSVGAIPGKASIHNILNAECKGAASIPERVSVNDLVHSRASIKVEKRSAIDVSKK